MILAQTSVMTFIIPGFLFGGIIGLYVWVSRQRNEVNKQMASHLADMEIHPSKTNIVFKDVCNVQVQRIEESVKGVCDRVDERHKVIMADIAEIKDILRSK